MPNWHAWFHWLWQCECIRWKGRDNSPTTCQAGEVHEEFFKQLGMEWVLSNELFQSLQEFTCKLYCSQPGTDNINEMRYRLFCAKKGNIDSTQLPPHADCLLNMLLEKTSKQSFGSEVCNAALWHPRPAVLAGGKAAITLPLTGWAVTQPLQPC